MRFVTLTVAWQPSSISIYLNDFEYSISNAYPGLNKLSQDFTTHLSDDDVEVFLRIFSMLYADDTIVMAESAKELQNALNAVHDYCRTWFLTVNTSKTKIIVFSRGKTRQHPIFTYGSDSIETVDDYVYLGCQFNYNNKFNKTKSRQVSQGRRAMFSLLTKSKKLELPLDIQSELFDQLVSPILLYGSEIWGYEDCKILESFHVKFCKNVLKVNKNTANCIALGELGRVKIRYGINCRMLCFWLRLKSGNSSKLSCTMLRLLKSMSDAQTYSSPWISKKLRSYSMN